MRKLSKIIFILMLFQVLILSTHNSYAFESSNYQVVSSNKVWNIQFNKELKYDEALQKSIIVVDSTGKLVNTKLQLGKDVKSILVKPPVEGYALGELYAMKINTDIYSKMYGHHDRRS